MLIYKVIFGLYCVDIPYDVCMSSINSLFMAFKAFPAAIRSIVDKSCVMTAEPESFKVPYQAF